MANPLISVIIPVYNVENFLHDCLNSVISQTYTNLEIILVDDGSTDKSGEICDEFAQKDNRIKVLHQKNSGQAVARNNALGIMQGEYLSFVDSDDIIDENYIQILFDLTKKYDTKISMANYKEFSKNEQIQSYKAENLQNNDEKLLEPKDIFIGSCVEKCYYLTAVWRCLFHRDIFKNLRFPAGEIHEDVAIWFEIFNNAKKIISIKKNIYFWRDNLASTVRKKIDDKFFVIIKNTQKFTNQFELAYPQYTKFARYKMCCVYSSLSYKIISNESIEYYDSLPKYHFYVRKNLDLSLAFKYIKISFTNKILFLFYIHPKLPCNLVNFYSKFIMPIKNLIKKVIKR
ncbi:MAG: glycosyltransferase [Campylobacter sp.]|nr:glycosyltransferase [Campylobacter sp.]MBR7047775.1 glycosyltransferase [Campylobacter sp.]